MSLEDRTAEIRRDLPGLRRDAFQEDMLGGNVKVMLAPGTFVGVTGYEARYDRGWIPTSRRCSTRSRTEPGLTRGPRPRDLQRLHQRLRRRERHRRRIQVPPGAGRRGPGRLRQRVGAGRVRLPAGSAQQFPVQREESRTPTSSTPSASGTTCTCWPSGAITTWASTTPTAGPSATTAGTR